MHDAIEFQIEGLSAPGEESLKSFCENYGDAEEVVAGDSVVAGSVLPEFLVVVSEKAVGVGLAV